MASTENTPGSLSKLRPLGEVDRLVHEPGRLLVMALLYVVETADFIYLARETGLTRGNLSSHMRKLEQADYVGVEKKFVNRMPRTLYRLTAAGRAAFQSYRSNMLEGLGSLPAEEPGQPNEM